MNSVKKLSDENKSDVAKWVWKNEWRVMSDGNWVTEIKWWKKLTQTGSKAHWKSGDEEKSIWYGKKTN